tara:strand:- start:759 stop:1352 length:594 start_codon:yes stop_codon:yes gene_type:complete
MPFIGVQPASALLTSADIQDGQITTAKVADDAITGAKIENNPTIAGTLNASAGLTTPSGHVIQVAQGTQGGAVNFTSSSYNASSLDVDFTPQFTSSKVFVLCNFSVDTQAGGRQLYATIYRDSTRLDSIAVSGAYGFATSYEAGDRQINTLTCMVLDSPSTTSSIHYELYCRGANTDQVQIGSQSVANIITCMEIAG